MLIFNLSETLPLIFKGEFQLFFGYTCYVGVTIYYWIVPTKLDFHENLN